MDVTWTDRVEAVTFNNIRLGQAFFVDYDNGERCLYMRITEMADLQDQHSHITQSIFRQDWNSVLN